MLWIHALSGVVWTGACAAFVLAGSAIRSGSGSDEWREFGTKMAPRLGRLNLAAAAALLATGIVNLAIAAHARDYAFSRAFVTILGAKIGLFVAMALALAGSWRAARMIVGSDAVSGINRMIRLSTMTVMAGTLALALGLWLMGS